MMKRKCTTVLLCFYQAILLLDFIDQTLASNTEICNANSIQGVNVTLHLSLSNLTMYEGNCTCVLNRQNVAGNVTMTSDIQIETCDTVTLDVDYYNYSAGCPGRHVNKSTQFVPLGPRIITVFMTRTNTDTVAAIEGSITFTSHGTDPLALICYETIYEIYITTTSSSTPTTTDIPATATVAAVAAGVVFGFIILLLIICLCIRYRQKRRKEHDALSANKRGDIPLEDRERVDPEMLHMSWFRSITFRLKRRYTGDAKRPKSGHGHGRGVKGRTQSRIENGDVPTGTQAKRKFQRLFRTKSGGSIGSQKNNSSSGIEEDYRSSTTCDETNMDQEVFEEIPPQQGGGIFMDSRSSSYENLEKEVPGREGYESVITVHTDQHQPSLSVNVGDYAQVDDYKDNQASNPVGQDEHYAAVDTIGLDKHGETSSTESATAERKVSTPEDTQNMSQDPTELASAEGTTESVGTTHSMNGDEYSYVNKNRNTQTNDIHRYQNVKAAPNEDISVRNLFVCSGRVGCVGQSLLYRTRIIEGSIDVSFSEMVKLGLKDNLRKKRLIWIVKVIEIWTDL